VGVVSPELVLVDPELAEWCRLRLRELAVAAEAQRTESPVLATPSMRVPRRANWPRLLARDSVAVIAAVLLFGASGAASRPVPSSASVRNPKTTIAQLFRGKPRIVLRTSSGLVTR
jgi:hypothetical protein